MPGQLSFCVLGPLEVRREDGSPVDLGGPQARLLLGRLLIAEGRVVASDTLVDLLWDQAPPASATGMVQTYVSRLRRSFGAEGAELISYGSGGYALKITPDQVDAHRFERLAAEGDELLGKGDSRAAEVLRNALKLWRGEVLGDLDADFVRAATARLEELRLTATENLYDAELRAGRHAAVVADLTDAVTASPLRERLRGLLAIGLYRSGRQAEALATLDEGRRILLDELGLDPSRELRDLQAAILAQARDLDPPRPARDRVIPTPTPEAMQPEAGQPDPAATPTPGDRPDPALIGRASELKILREVLAEVLAGHGSRYVVIDGEPGIGKTTLARALLHEAAAQGVAVRTTGTLEDGAAPAYGPWLALVRAARQRSEAVPDAFDRLLEGTGQVMHGAVPSAVASDVADSVAAHSVALAGRCGLLLLFEDLQWADPASLSLLAALGPRLAAAPVLIVVTVRDLEIDRNDSVVDTLARLTRYVGTRRLTLRGLTRAESQALARRATGQSLPANLVSAMHDRSEGNPFFTTELARMLNELGELTDQEGWFSAVPTGVRDVLRRRLARLPPSTVALLEVAAVLGRRVDLGLLARVADRPLDDCLDDLEPALLTRLVVTPADAPGSVAFTHALVRETLADQLTSLRRARLHLRAADGILASSGARDDTAEVVAEHLWQAAAIGVGNRAAAALETAAQVALKREALVSAESLLQRAASLYRAAGTEAGLAELRVLRQLGFVGAALHGYAVNADSDLVRRARELARATDRPDILLDLIWADWAGCDTGGQPDRAELLVREAEALVGTLDDPLLQAAVASMRGFAERHFGRMASSYDFIERAVRLFVQAGPSQEAGFYLNGYLTSRGYRHWARALTSGLDRQALEAEYLAQDLPFARMVISLFGAAATMAVGDEPGLRLFADRMAAADPSMALSFWSASAELYGAVSLLQHGDLERGLERFERGQAAMRQAEGRTMQAGLNAAAAQALFTAGAVETGRELLKAARQELVETFELAYEPVVEIAEAYHWMAEGDRQQAAACLDLAAKQATDQGSFGLVDRVARERLNLFAPVPRD